MPSGLADYLGPPAASVINHLSYPLEPAPNSRLFSPWGIVAEIAVRGRAKHKVLQRSILNMADGYSCAGGVAVS